MGTLKSEAERFSNETTIHGFQELWNFRFGWKMLWATIMIFVVVSCAWLLHVLVTDFLAFPAVTSVSEIEKFDPPPEMILHTRGYLGELGKQQVPKSFKRHFEFAEYQGDAYYIETIFQKTLEELFFTKEGYNECPYLSPSLTTSYSNFLKQKYPEKKSFEDDETLKEAVNDLFREYKTVANLMDQSFSGPLSSPVVWHGEQPGGVERSIGAMGPRFKFNISSEVYAGKYLFEDPNKKVSLTSVNLDCPADRSVTYYLTIGGEFGFAENVDPSIWSPEHSLTIHCGHGGSRTLIVTLKKVTYHDQYCNPKMTHLCHAECLITKTRESGSCLRYLGIPEKRKNVPLCGFESSNCKKGLYQVCADECESCSHHCQPCSSYEVIERSMKNSFGGNTDIRNLTVVIRGGSKAEHVHTEPKYSVANFLSGLGGILGICFGISVVSIIQVFIFVLSLIKLLISSSKA